ncbi:hypothetical protein ACFLRF_00905 [Candidatus Altiarchaeota archaeon]
MRTGTTILVILILASCVQAYVEPQVEGAKARPRAVLPHRPNRFTVSVDATVPWWPLGECYPWYFVVCGMNSAELMFLVNGTPYPNATDPYLVPLDVSGVGDFCANADVWQELDRYGVPWDYFDEVNCLNIPESVVDQIDSTELKIDLPASDLYIDIPGGRYTAAVKVTRIVDAMGFYVELGGTYVIDDWFISPPAWGLRRKHQEREMVTVNKKLKVCQMRAGGQPKCTYA